MRILFIHTYYFPEIVGGAEYSVKKLVEALQKTGNDVAVLCTADADKEEQVENVTVYRRKMCCVRREQAFKEGGFVNKLHTLQEIYNPSNAAVISDVLEAFQPDVIHTNCLYDITPVAWKVTRRKGIRLVHTLRDYALLCRYANMQREDGTLCTRADALCSVSRMMNKFHSRFVDVVTAPSVFTLRVFQEAGFFTACQNEVIPNAIDFSWDNVVSSLEARKSGTDRQSFQFVFLGALTEAKGILWLLDSFSRLKLKQVKLVFAGKGFLERRVCEAAVRDSRIRYVGFISETEVNSLLAESNALICPSLWNEPFGRVILDAYKNAMPVIVSDRGALPEIVDNGSTGKIVPANNVEALEMAMADMAGNQKKYVEMCENAANMLQKFHIERQANSFLKIYAG